MANGVHEAEYFIQESISLLFFERERERKIGRGRDISGGVQVLVYFCYGVFERFMITFF